MADETPGTPDSQGSGSAQEELAYEGGGLSRETNWWGAFVVGLAGTILVTGIAPVMVTIAGGRVHPADHLRDAHAATCSACSWPSSRR